MGGGVGGGTVGIYAFGRIGSIVARVGAAKDMVRYKEQMPAIMAAGRWKSPEMVARYTGKESARDSAAKRLADAREPF